MEDAWEQSVRGHTQILSTQQDPFYTVLPTQQGSVYTTGPYPHSQVLSTQGSVYKAGSCLSHHRNPSLLPGRKVWLRTRVQQTVMGDSEEQMQPRALPAPRQEIRQRRQWYPPAPQHQGQCLDGLRTYQQPELRVSPGSQETGRQR